MAGEKMTQGDVFIRVGGLSKDVADQLERSTAKLTKDHSLVGEGCPACGELLKVFDPIVMIPLGPGSDVEAQKKAVSGMAFNAVAVVVHRACGTGNTKTD